jgi:hypothetical protein
MMELWGEMEEEEEKGDLAGAAGVYKDGTRPGTG